MKPNLVRLFARVSAALLVLHLFFFWAAERRGAFLGFTPEHFKDTAILFFLIAVYLLLESHFLVKEREVVEEEIVSITEEAGEATVARAAAMRAGARSPFVNPYVASAFIIGAALIVAGFILSGVRGEKKDTGSVPSPAAQAPAASPSPAAPQTPPGPKVAAAFGDTPILNKNAKVKFIEFSDLQCSFCARFYSDSFGQLKKKYIDTGKIAYQHRDYPLPFHQNAQKAAEATRCALEQKEAAYWSITDWMYKNQTTLDAVSLKNMAKTLGLNSGKFDQCLDSGKYADAVKKDYDAGTSYGVQGTPSFFLNGEFIVGAQPTAAFEQKIEAALAVK